MRRLVGILAVALWLSTSALPASAQSEIDSGLLEDALYDAIALSLPWDASSVTIGIRRRSV